MSQSITQKHPKGLYFIYTVAIAERFGYYGMRALFVLYMIKALAMDKELSSVIYGNYTGLVYLTPLIGGYVADNYLALAEHAGLAREEIAALAENSLVVSWMDEGEKAQRIAELRRVAAGA